MKSYLGLVPEYVKAHKKKNRLTMLCIIIAVMLVSAVFGMADMSVQTQINEQIRTNGNFHIMLSGLPDDTARQISARRDVRAAGWVAETAEAAFAGKTLRILGGDPAIAAEMNMSLTEGCFPASSTEAILNAAAKEQLGLAVGDTIGIDFMDGHTYRFSIAGFYGDTAVLKRADEHGLFLTLEGVRALPRDADAEHYEQFIVQFRSGVNIRRAIAELKTEYRLGDTQVSENARLVGLLGFSSSSTIMQIYFMAAILFVLVLLAGTFMISSSFNMSVLERTQFFGMLRCLGATKRQIKRYIRLEGLRYCLTGIPIGLLAGCVVMWAAALVLKYVNAAFFSDMPLFQISLPALLAGAALGFLTVMLASRSPANKAARVSPQAAVTGNVENASNQMMSRPLAAKRFRIDTAMGIGHAFANKKNVVLITGSFAISIILLLCFSVLISFMNHALRPLQPYAPDISVVGADEKALLSRSIFEDIKAVSGVRNAYGRMFLYDFMAENGQGGSLATLISFEEKQFAWFGENLIDGNLEDVENGSGVLAVYTGTSQWGVGDKIRLHLPGGEQEVTIVGVLSHSPFDTAAGSEILICAEPTFTALTGVSDYTIIDLQVDADVAAAVRSLLTPEMRLLDKQEGNREARAAYNTMSVFVYGFLAVIALVAVINIINTVNAGVASRMRNYGVMRAVGMSGLQLRRMVMAEAAAYAITGSTVGCLLGVPLHRLLFQSVILKIWGEAWELPVAVLAVTVFAAVLTTFAAVFSPTRKLKEMPIVHAINTG